MIACRAADVFRTRLGLSDWERMVDLGSGNFDPTPGHRYLFHALSDSSELKRFGIYSLTLVIALPEHVSADIRLNRWGVSLIVRPGRVSVEVDMYPFGGLVYRSLTESEIDEMRRECEPFRIVMEAVEAASAQLKAEAEAQKEDAE